MGKKITDETRDKIFLLHTKGLSVYEIASVTGSSRPTINTLIKTAKDAEKKDIEALRHTDLHISKAVVKWACAKYGIPYDEAIQGIKSTEHISELNPPRQDNPTTTLDDVENAIHVAAMKLADGIIPHLEALEKKLDQLATVIQSCTVDERKTVDANTDILAAELKRQSDFLGAIKMNTKKQTIWKGAAE